MTKTYTCILCPNGCEITVEYEGQTFKGCTGNLCPNGEKYVQQELTDPRRTIASSVLVEGGELPLVSVRLTKPVPRDRIFDVMDYIRTLHVAAPVERGTVLAENILGLESDLIATRAVKKN
ncbi:MAG: DUF1667 domain-containing protein [Clostridia bacterium]|nr:DUF1667 domain-containing protein [Clostridia bacterium]